MSYLVIPMIDTAGFYELKPPLDILILKNERYVCKAIRRISELIANNQDPKTNIYDKYNIPEIDYNEDLNNDMIIISLQNDVGNWLHVPARFIVKYPEQSGIGYRSYAIGISLPAFPIYKDFTPVTTAITNLLKDMLGVTAEIKLIETSRTVLVDDATHRVNESSRNLSIVRSDTDRARYLNLIHQHQQTLDKLHALEEYVLNLVT